MELPHEGARQRIRCCGSDGHLYAESGLRSDNLENSAERRLGYSDASYTEAVDAGDV